MTAGFTRHQRHRPHGHDQRQTQGERPAGHLDDQRRRSPSGQFSIWVVTPRNGWYVGKIRAADGTASYADSVDLERARRQRLPRLRLLPRHDGDPWGLYGMSPGTVDVTAGFTRHHRHRPHRHDQPGPGRPPAGHLDDQRRRSPSGQFSIWVVSSPATAGTSARSTPPPTAPAPATPTRSTSTCPPTTATTSSSTTAPRSGDPWGLYG